MKDLVYIFGHKNPDTDSICSAIAYAELKRKMGLNAKAYRLGALNAETKYVLDYFKIPEPEFLDSVEPRLEDVDLYPEKFFTSEMPLKTAWDYMNETGRSLTPIVNKDKVLIGIVSKTDITKTFTEHRYEEEELQKQRTNFQNILEVLDGKLVSGKYKSEKIQGMIYVSSEICIDQKLTDGDIVIVGKNKRIQENAILSGAGCIILSGEAKLDDNLKELAEENKIAVVETPHSFYRVINQINLILPISAVMKTDDIVFFFETDYIDDVTKKLHTSIYREFPVVDFENKLLGSISRQLLLEYNKKKVIMVDHNERIQSVNGIERAEILEIIDHHRVSDIHTEKPVFIKCEPVGCTATLITEMYLQNDYTINPKIAGILMSAILSDTLICESPTCTKKDKRIVEILSEIANLEPKKFGYELIIAGTSLDEKTESEIFNSDLKVYHFGDIKMAIAQVNTGDHKSLAPRKQKIRDYMAKACKENNYDFALLMITDIIKTGSELIFVGKHKSIFEHAFKKDPDSDYIFLPNVVSRKKQIVPALEHSASLK
ncbi:MAG: putative manganese-dependent inorganic diphosphatase [Candidatus Helarchaeota archaeon]